MLFPQKINVVASARHKNPHNETVVVQNDTAVEFYVAVVGDNGQTELPEGATYTLVCLHLRKQPTEKLGTLQEDGNVMFNLTHMELSETGPVQGQVRVYHPVGGRLTSNPFIFHVAPDPTYGAEIKPEDQSIIEQVIGEGPGIIAEAKEETTKNITERARLTGAVDGALSSLADDKAQALLEMSQSKDAADQSAQVAQQAADNADDERERLTLEVSDKLNEVETARSATVEATGEATEAAGLARDEADAARLQKEEVQQILGAGPVASVNGETGVVTGLATQESMNQVTAQLADKVGGQRKLKPEEFSDEAMALLTGNGTVNVLSEPQAKSVTPEKVEDTFLKIIRNKHETVVEHPSTGYADRPDVATVTWIGVNEPTQAEPYDEWRETEGFTYFTDFNNDTLTEWTDVLDPFSSKLIANGALELKSAARKAVGIVWENVTPETDNEIYFNVLHPPNNNVNGQTIAALHKFYNGSTSAGYVFIGVSSSDLRVARKIPNVSTTTELGRVAHGLDLTQPYNQVSRIDGNRVRAKIWQNGQPEPKEWQIDIVDANMFYESSGVGLYNFMEYNTYFINSLGVGTNGMKAPRRGVI